MTIKHHFAADAYVREMHIPAGHKGKKHTHTYDHISILGYGTVVVCVDNSMTVYNAPSCIEIKAGKEHEVLAVTDAVWYCIHGTTDEITDLHTVEVE